MHLQISWQKKLLTLVFLAYPEEAVLGPTVLDVPIEELFFFVVQTYIVSFREALRYLS